MTIIAVLLTAVVTAIVTYKVAVAVNTPKPSTALAAPLRPKRIVVRMGKPFGAMPVMLVRRVAANIKMALVNRYPTAEIAVIDAIETEANLVVVDGDITPLDATILSAWIHGFVYPR